MRRVKTKPTNVGDVVRVGSRRHPSRPALGDGSGAKRTYADLDQRTNRLAHATIGMGLVRGDRMAA
jgi:acyl-CoA synthetase (AMP-forming)/AMP-acid ligase II